MNRTRKTRIVKVVRESGAVEYSSQWKGWLFWNPFEAYVPFCTPFAEQAYEEVFTKSASFLEIKLVNTRSLEFHKQVIDKYVELVGKPKKDKIKSKEYIDYP